jgi:hypothetical protein
MNAVLTDILDDALERLHTGEPLPTILVRYPAQAEALTPLLNAATALEIIRPVEMPAPEVLLADRNDFLAEIVRLQYRPVSPSPLVRLKEWIARHTPQQLPNLIPQRKEQRRMSALLIKAGLIVSLIFGSAGGAAAVAAGSLPDSPLYPAKLAMEQVRLNRTTDPADQSALHLTLAQMRAREVERLALTGKVPDEATLTRLQTHLDQSFNLAAQLPDEEMLGLLNQAQQMTQTQEQAMMRAQAQAAGPAQESLRQASGLLSQARQEAEMGLQDPQAFRWRHAQNRPPEAPPQPTMEPMPGGGTTPPGPTVTPQPNGPCPTGDCEPAGDENHNGPQPEQPGPGMPGGNPDCPTGDCEPAGDQHQHGPQPARPGSATRARDQLGPGMPGGNPDCVGDCEPAGDQHQPGPGMPGGNPDCTGDCEPAGDENHYGPQPEQPGPGMPGGNPDCTGDCEPAGDENHYGPQPEQPGDSGGEEPAPSEPEPSAPESPSPPDHGGDGGGGDGGGHGGGGGKHK